VNFRLSVLAFVSLGVLSVALLNGAPARAVAAPVCGPSRSDLRTVRQTPSIRVFERRDDSYGDVGRRYLCRRGHVAVWSLTTSGIYSSGQTPGPLIGAFLLVTEASGGAVGDDGRVVRVVDTRTGRYAETGSSYQNMGYDEVQFSREGIAVWLQTRSNGTDTTADVMAVGSDGRAVVLDNRGAASGLQLVGRTVTWRQAGAPQPPFAFTGPPRYRYRLTRVVFARR
jgi:hypothetical protein